MTPRKSPSTPASSVCGLGAGGAGEQVRKQLVGRDVQPHCLVRTWSVVSSTWTTSAARSLVRSSPVNPVNERAARRRARRPSQSRHRRLTSPRSRRRSARRAGAVRAASRARCAHVRAVTRRRLGLGREPSVVTFPQWHGPVLGADQRGLRSVEHWRRSKPPRMHRTGHRRTTSTARARGSRPRRDRHWAAGSDRAHQLAFPRRRPSCLRALFASARRSARVLVASARFPGASEDGGNEEFCELLPRRVSSSATWCQSPDLASECTVVFSERLDLLPQHRVLGEQRLERAVPIVIRHVQSQATSV